jgi:hypothetical protein
MYYREDRRRSGTATRMADVRRRQARTGRPVVLAFVKQRLRAVVVLSIEGRLITKFHTIADPDKIGFLSDQLTPANRGGNL